MKLHDDGHSAFRGEGSTSPFDSMPADQTDPTLSSFTSVPLINTVQELIGRLNTVSGMDGYSGILERVDIPWEEFSLYCHWNDRRYTRTCITRTEDFELLLICYEIGQQTSIHDYDTEQAWVRPVLGSIVEERFELNANGDLVSVGSSLLKTGFCSHLMRGHNIHRYSNQGSNRSASLNLYAKPLLKWKVYEEGA